MGRCRKVIRWLCQAGALLTFCLGVLFGDVRAFTQTDYPDWQEQIRESVTNHQLRAALEIAERWLAQDATDLEAHGWHARLLSWNGRWAEAEQEYRQIVERVPNDADILSGLADVLVWQQKQGEALSVLDRAMAVAPQQADVLPRRAKLLRAMGYNQRARADYDELLRLDPQNREAQTGLASLRGPGRHELRIGADVDTFNYTESAQAQSLSLVSRWSERWGSAFGTTVYQRFGQHAIKFTASTTCRIAKSDWLGVGGAMAHDSGVIPKGEAFFEYGHGFRFHASIVRGLEASYQQRWLWYEGAHVLTLTLSQIYYLPRDWTWAFTMTGARSGFSDRLADWVPSGSTRLAFPLVQRLSASVSFGVGSENFAQVDQIGRFSARTYGGGLKYRLTESQEITGHFGWQDRTQNRTQRSFGMSYGIRF